MPTIRLSLLLLSTLFLLVACETEPTVDPDDLDDEEVDTPTWTEDVQPILTAYCGGCHEGDALGSGGIGWLNSYENVTTDAFAGVCDGATRAECIPVRLLDGSMPDGNPCPPGEEGCITDNQFATVENWVDGGMPE